MTAPDGLLHVGGFIAPSWIVPVMRSFRHDARVHREDMREAMKRNNGQAAAR